MTDVNIEKQGDVAVLRLDNGVTNAMGPAMVEDLSAALAQVKEDCSGVILAGGPKFFSIGLNLPELLELDRAGMTDFFLRFNELVLELYTLPKPTVCAIAGHAIAGGTIMALSCDLRVSVAEPKQMGLNEIKLGLPVPYLADLMLRQIVDDRTATWMLYGGKFMPLTDGHRIGLIDATAEAGELESLAISRVEELTVNHPVAFAAIKGTRVEEVCSRYERKGSAKNRVFLDCWYRPEIQLLLKEAATKF